MSITEKKKNIEFSYLDDDGFRYDVIFDPLSKTISLLNTSGENLLSFPASLFFETMEFLANKGYAPSKPNFPSPVLCVGSHQREMSGLPHGSIPQGAPIQKSSLPIPEIIRKGDSVEEQNQYKMKSSIDPVSSFDVSQYIDIFSEGQEKVEDSNKEEIVVEKAPPISFVPVLDDTQKIENINRPVIRTRPKKGDPLSAEKEAADLRAGLTKSEKRIKRASDQDAE